MLSDNMDADYKVSKSEEEKFNEYLSFYQPDIKKLLASKRKAHHLMSVDDIVSDFNLNIIRAKQKIISYRDDRFKDFNKEGFHYLICIYVKNVVGWFHSRETNRKYYKKRLNMTHQTDEGVKSTFDIVCKSIGGEESGDYDSSAKYKYMVKYIKEYSHWFTEREIEVFDLMLEGHKQIEIAKIKNVTHQAIGFTVNKIKDKLIHNIRYDLSSDKSWENITEGQNSIDKLFGYLQNEF
jgi:DNA-binding CsgD family transcriptional regulator